MAESGGGRGGSSPTCRQGGANSIKCPPFRRLSGMMPASTEKQIILLLGDSASGPRWGTPVPRPPVVLPPPSQTSFRRLCLWAFFNFAAGPLTKFISSLEHFFFSSSNNATVKRDGISRTRLEYRGSGPGVPTDKTIFLALERVRSHGESALWGLGTPACRNGGLGTALIDWLTDFGSVWTVWWWKNPRARWQTFCAVRWLLKV